MITVKLKPETRAYIEKWVPLCVNWSRKQPGYLPIGDPYTHARIALMGQIAYAGVLDYPIDSVGQIRKTRGEFNGWHLIPRGTDVRVNVTSCYKTDKIGVKIRDVYTINYKNSDLFVVAKIPNEHENIVLLVGGVWKSDLEKRPSKDMRTGKNLFISDLNSIEGIRSKIASWSETFVA